MTPRPVKVEETYDDGEDEEVMEEEREEGRVADEAPSKAALRGKTLAAAAAAAAGVGKAAGKGKGGKPVKTQPREEPAAVKAEVRRPEVSDSDLWRHKKRTEATLRDITCKAVCAVKHGLRQPGAQSDGKPFIPSDWDIVFKPQLGSYMKFLISRSDQFKVVEGAGPGLYTVKNITGDVTVKAPSWNAKAKGKGKSGKGKAEDAPIDGGKSWSNPKGAAKAKGKDGKAKGKGVKGFFTKGSQKISAASKRLAEEQAIEEIKKRLLKNPGIPQSGRGMMPPDWLTRFFPALGPYKEFLITHPEHFALSEDSKGAYMVAVAEQPEQEEWKDEEEDTEDRVRHPPTRAAKLLAAAAKEELADDAAATAELGADWEDERDIAQPAGLEDILQNDEYPVEKAASHGSLIRSLLGDGGSKPKRQRVA